MATNAERYFKIKGQEAGNSFDRYYGNPKAIEDESKLSLIDFKALGLTPDIIKNELLGLGDDLVDPTTGKSYTNEFYNSMIDRAVSHVEKKFDIVIRPRINHERLDFNRSDFQGYMYMHTKEKPIIQVDEMLMQFNNQPFMKFEDRWLKVNNRFGQIEVNPDLIMNITNGMNLTPLINSMSGGGLPYMTQVGGTSSYGSTQYAPQMVGITYIAGMLPPSPADRGINREWYIHPDLISYIAKSAAIEVLERWGRLILGAGIAGYNISVDGISTGVDSTQSAENTGSTADIKLLQEDMKPLADSLQSYYGINLGIIA